MHMNRKRALLISCAVILLCMSTIVGMTFALFTENRTITHHLKAGELDVRLTRTSLVYTQLLADGTLKTVTKNTDADKIDLTEATDTNVFGLDSSQTLIIPGSYFQTTLELKNDGNVAFDYKVEIKNTTGEAPLPEQLTVKVVHADNTTTTKKLSEVSGANTVEIAKGQMKATDLSTSFTVTVMFEKLSGTENNAAMNKTASFDLVITATQTAPPTN